MHEKITIDGKFNGPPYSGNGGYVCGLLANFIGQEAEVTLRKPAPLEQPLSILVNDDQEARLLDGETLIAYGYPKTLNLEVPNPPSIHEVKDAEQRYVGIENHIFPTCFVCGPLRRIGDGLRIFSGSLAHGNGVACSWISHDSLSADDGFVAPEFIWASLDCPGYFAVVGSQKIIALLGRMSVQIIKRPIAGETCLLLGWRLGKEGRKRYAGTALFSEAGDLYGMARATWYDIQR
jgi:hypothetical protein